MAAPPIAPAYPPEDTAEGMRVQDVRLIELGMAVERSMSLHRQLSGASESSPSSSRADLALKLDSVQAAIDDVRESLSPAPRSQRSTGAGPSVVETRIGPLATNWSGHNWSDDNLQI